MIKNVKDNPYVSIAIDVVDDALNNPMVQFSIGMPRHILVSKPVKVVSWDLAKLANPNIE
jgi:hypothetical protein